MAFAVKLSECLQSFKNILIRPSRAERSILFAERYGEPGHFRVVDGQHRLNAYRDLLARYARHGESFQEVLERIRTRVKLPKQDAEVIENLRVQSSQNPCAEIPLDQSRMSVLNVGYTGSPWHTQLAWTQHRWIAKSAFRFAFPIHEDSVVVELVGHVPLNKKKLKQLAEMCRSQFAREIVYAFYNQSRKTNWWGEYSVLSRFLTREENEKLAVECAAMYYDAIGPGRNAGIEMPYRTSTVHAITKGMFQDEAFDRAPILADALQDAGYDQEDVLNHLRSGGVKSCGSWIFRTMGLS